MIAVLGAGAAGLAAALELRDGGHEVVVLEASDRAGGKVGTMREGGYTMERAALGLLDREGILAPLAARLGIVPVPAGEKARRRWVVRDGVRHALPSGPLSLLTTRLFTFREKLSLLREPWRKPLAVPEESVAAFFARRLGLPGSFLGDAIQSGVYAGDPDRLELASAFPTLEKLEREHGSLVRGARHLPKARLASFAGGLGELMGAMAAAVAPVLRLGVRARAVHRTGPNYRISTLEGAGLGELECDAIVCALPAPDAASALETLDADLAARLRELRAAPLALVHLGVARRSLRGPVDGFGVLAPGRAVVGTLFPDALWEGRAPQGSALISALVGGARNPQAASLPDDELVDLVRSESRLFEGAPDLVRVVRWPQAVPQYEPGHARRVDVIEGLAARHPRLALAGSWYRGVGVLDCLRQGRAAARAAAT